MKRDRRLWLLSDDHHAALVLARHATRAGAGEGSRSAQEVWAEVMMRFEQELNAHFELEERLLLPAVERVGEPALAERTRDEHAQLRRLVTGVPGPLETRLSEFGALLRDHVRFEERVLFPAVQERLGQETLEAIADASQRLRSDRALS